MRQKQAHTTGRRQLSPSSTTKRKYANYSVRRQSLSSAELGSKVRARSLELETRTVARALSRRRSLNRGTELYEFRIVKSRPASLYRIPERRSGGWRVGPTVSWPGESERHSSVSCRTEVSSTGSRVRPATRTDMSEVREVGRSPSIPERLHADVTADLYHHMAVYHPCHIGLPAACSTRSSGRRDCDLRSSFTRVSVCRAHIVLQSFFLGTISLKASFSCLVSYVRIGVGVDGIVEEDCSGFNVLARPPCEES